MNPANNQVRALSPLPNLKNFITPDPHTKDDTETKEKAYQEILARKYKLSLMAFVLCDVCLHLQSKYYDDDRGKWVTRKRLAAVLETLSYASDNELLGMRQIWLTVSDKLNRIKCLAKRL